MPYCCIPPIRSAITRSKYHRGSQCKNNPSRTSRKKSAPTGKFRAAERAATEAQRREARCQRFGTPHKAAAGDTKGYRKRRPGTQSKATAEKRKGKFVKKHKPMRRGRQSE